MTKKITYILIVVLVIGAIFTLTKEEEKDERHYSDGSSIVCRVDGCGEIPAYSNWDDRFCSQHLNKSKNHSEQYDSSVAKFRLTQIGMIDFVVNI